MKTEKVMYTFGTVSAGLAHDVAHTDCWIQNGSSDSCVFAAAFKRRILRNWSKKSAFWGCCFLGWGCYVVCVYGGGGVFV